MKSFGISPELGISYNAFHMNPEGVRWFSRHLARIVWPGQAR